MGAFTRIPADTFSQIQTDAGILLYNFDPAKPDEVKDADIICPTTGGITAACEPTYSDMGEDVDNCPANLLELKHLDSWNCHLNFTSLGTTPKSIRLALGAADVDSENPTHIIPRVNLKTSDASDVWWVGDRADGGMVAVCLKRALSTAGFSLQTTKSGKGQTSVTLTGHVSVATQSEVPMEFYSIGLATLTLTSAEGGEEGQTKITVTENKLNVENKRKYKVGPAAESVMYGDKLDGWTDGDETLATGISAEEGDIVSVAEADKNDKAVAFGSVEAKPKASEAV